MLSFTSRRFTSHRHATRIAAEEVDMFLDPLQRKPLIEESCIGHAPSSLQSRPGQEAESTEAVVHRHEDQAVLLAGSVHQALDVVS